MSRLVVTTYMIVHTYAVYKIRFSSACKVNGGNSVIFVVKLLFLNDSKEAFSAT